MAAIRVVRVPCIEAGLSAQHRGEIGRSVAERETARNEHVLCEWVFLSIAAIAIALWLALLCKMHCQCRIR